MYVAGNVVCCYSTVVAILPVKASRGAFRSCSSFFRFSFFLFGLVDAEPSFRTAPATRCGLIVRFYMNTTYCTFVRARSGVYLQRIINRQWQRLHNLIFVSPPLPRPLTLESEF